MDKRQFASEYKIVNPMAINDTINYRWDAVNSIVETINVLEDNKIEMVIHLLNVYYGIDEAQSDVLDVFFELDSTFDSKNKEEIKLLFGIILTLLLNDEDINFFIANYILMLDKYYENIIKELPNKAQETIAEIVKMGSTGFSMKLLNYDAIKDAENTSLKIVGTVNRLITNAKEEFAKNQEKINVLSWVVGEWSDLLEMPLEKVEKISAAFVLGVELAELSMSKTGIYPVKGFLTKMLDKCKEENELLSLTMLIDRQDENIRKKVLALREEVDERNLVIHSALKKSLEVDNKREWIPAFKKQWKFDPDEVKLSYLDWAILLYRECMVDKY